MKNIAIFSDIHGNLLLLNKVLGVLEDEHIDGYIVCGDSITDGFENNEVLDLIQSKTQNIVAGNREVSIANYDEKLWESLTQFKPMLYVYNQLSQENKEYIASLPIFKIIEVDGKKIMISHGGPYNVRELVDENSKELFDRLIEEYPCDIYLFGHTHIPFSIEYKGRKFINPGAINCSVNGMPISSYGILSIGDDHIEYIQKGYEYSFEEVKSHYLTSEYYKECPEYCNLLIYTLKEGIDHLCYFVDYVNKYSNGNAEINSSMWNEKFKEYMELKGLTIL